MRIRKDSPFHGITEDFKEYILTMVANGDSYDDVAEMWENKTGKETFGEQVRRFVTFAGVDFILLDNMSNAMLKEAVALRAGGILFEASGGVNLQTVRAIAETGVDFISVGALTHSAVALDFSLELT